MRRVDLPDRAGVELQGLVPRDARVLRDALAARGVAVPANGQVVLRVTAR